MHRLRSMSRSGWITVGLVLGAIAVPGAALAAGASLVTISGHNHSAAVTPAGQLRTADTDPSLLLHMHGSGAATSPAACQTLTNTPASRPYLLKQINVMVDAVGTAPSHSVYVFAGPTCSSPWIGGTRFTEAGLQSIPLGSGVAIPAGTPISIEISDVYAYVDAFGYTLPPGSVPNTAAARRAIGPVGGVPAHGPKLR